MLVDGDGVDFAVDVSFVIILLLWFARAPLISIIDALLCIRLVGKIMSEPINLNQYHEIKRLLNINYLWKILMEALMATQ